MELRNLSAEKKQQGAILAIGGLVLVVVLVLVLKGGGASAAPASSGGPVVLAGGGAPSAAVLQAQAQERSDALKASLDLVSVRNDRDIRMRGLDIQEKQVTGTLSNQRADIDARERVGLADIGMRRDTTLADINARREIGLADISAKREIGVREQDNKRLADQNAYMLADKKVTIDGQLQRDALGMSYSLQSVEQGMKYALEGKKEDNRVKVEEKKIASDESKHQTTTNANVFNNFVGGIFKLLTFGLGGW